MIKEIKEEKQKEVRNKKYEVTQKQADRLIIILTAASFTSRGLLLMGFKWKILCTATTSSVGLYSGATKSDEFIFN